VILRFSRALLHTSILIGERNQKGGHVSWHLVSGSSWEFVIAVFGSSEN
jgi:hypothetical protein